MSYTLIQVGAIWHYRFQLDGVRTQKSTKEKSRNKAAEVANEAWEIAKLISRDREAVPTLSGLLESWINTHRPVMSEHYVRAVEQIAKSHTYGMNDRKIHTITTEDMEQARAKHLDTHARASANTWLITLGVVFRWAVRRKMIRAVPWQVKSLKVQKKKRATISVESINEFLSEIDACCSSGISAGVRLMLGLGLRESEALTARWEWIDWQRKTYTPGKTKGFEAVAIPIAPWLYKWLTDRFNQLLPDPSSPIAAKSDGSPYSRAFASAAIKSAGAKVGVHGLTPHRLRGTFATLLSEHGVSVQNIQHVMRHKDSITTMKYLEVNMDEVRRGSNEIAEKAGISNNERSTT